MLWTVEQMNEWRERGFETTSRDAEVLEYANWISHLERRRKEQGDPGATYLECGVYKGFTALAAALAIQEAQTGSKILAVDTFDRSDIDEVRHNLVAAGVGNIVTLIKSDDISYVKTLSDNSLAGAFLDSDHRGTHVKQLLIATFRKLLDNALLCGHDYCPREASLVKVVDEFRMRYGDQLYGFGVFDSVWWTFKAEAKS